MRTASSHCCAWRRVLIGGAVAGWGLSLLGDAGWYTGWIENGRSIALYSIVAGILLMIGAAFVCGYDLQFQRETREANAELLDGGVILAAVVLFTLNAALRLQSPESALPILLSLLGFFGVLAELWLDDQRPGANLEHGGRRAAKA